MRHFSLAVLLSMASCSGGGTVFESGTAKICVPKDRQIAAPIWMGHGKDGSVAFSGCKDGGEKCPIPRNIDSVVLMPLGKFNGWRWGEFDKGAFYAREAVSSIRDGHFQYVDGRNIIKMVARDADRVTLYWRAGGSPGEVDELLMICDISRSEGANDSGARCMRMRDYDGFSVKYIANFDVVSISSIAETDYGLRKGVLSWTCK